MNEFWKKTLVTYQNMCVTTRVTGDVRTNWMPPENLHITVRFIGIVSKQCIPGLVAVLRGAATKVHAFTLTFAELGFATPGEPKMIWVRFTNSAVFQVCVREFTRYMTRYLVSCGGTVMKNGHEVLPHVTLARMKGVVRTGSALPKADALPKVLPVGMVVLYASETRPTGSVYRKIASFRLSYRRHI